MRCVLCFICHASTVLIQYSMESTATATTRRLSAVLLLEFSPGTRTHTPQTRPATSLSPKPGSNVRYHARYTRSPISEHPRGRQVILTPTEHAKHRAPPPPIPSSLPRYLYIINRPLGLLFTPPTDRRIDFRLLARLGPTLSLSLSLANGQMLRGMSRAAHVLGGEIRRALVRWREVTQR